jgi:hypothetical protein
MNYQDLRIFLDKVPPTSSVLLVRELSDGSIYKLKLIAKELSLKFWDIRLGQCERGDVYGLPTLDREMTPPCWWETDPETKGIILLDEIEKLMSYDFELAADVLFKIGIDRNLHSSLSDGWRVVITISPEMFSELDPSIADKFVVVHLDWFLKQSLVA